MIRVPDWAFEAAGQEMRGMGQDAAAYQPGLYLTPTQVSACHYYGQEVAITSSINMVWICLSIPGFL